MFYDFNSYAYVTACGPRHKKVDNGPVVLSKEEESELDDILAECSMLCIVEKEKFSSPFLSRTLKILEKMLDDSMIEYKKSFRKLPENSGFIAHDFIDVSAYHVIDGKMINVEYYADEQQYTIRHE